MIRSTTDEMLAARHDSEPYVILNGGGGEYLRCADHEDAIRALNESPAGYTMEHRPRVECIPSRDPKPWVNRNGDRYAHPRLTGAPLIFAPRVEYAHPEPNPILAAFRQEVGLQHDAQCLSTRSVAQLWLDRNEGAEESTPAQVEDARKVLTRLVEVFE